MSARSSITSENGEDQNNSDVEAGGIKSSQTDDNESKTEALKATEEEKRKKKKKKFHSGIDVSDDREFFEPIPICELKQIAQNCSKDLEINPSVLRAALRVMHKVCRPLDDEYIDKPVKHIELLVEPEEWACLNPNRLGIYESGPQVRNKHLKNRRRLFRFAPPHHKRGEPPKQKYETERNMLGSQKTTSYDK